MLKKSPNWPRKKHKKNKKPRASSPTFLDDFAPSASFELIESEPQNNLHINSDQKYMDNMFSWSLDKKTRVIDLTLNGTKYQLSSGEFLSYYPCGGQQQEQLRIAFSDTNIQINEFTIQAAKHNGFTTPTHIYTTAERYNQFKLMLRTWGNNISQRIE